MRQPLRTALFLLLLPALSGCIWSRELSQLRRDLEAQLPEARFRQQLVLNLGPLSLGAARVVSRLVPEADVRTAAVLLRDIRRIKVGLYEVESMPSLSTLGLPARLRRMLDRGNWDLAVRTQEEDALVYMLYRERRGTVREMFFVILEEDEMVLARVNGDLERVLARVLATYGPERPLL